MKHQGLLGAPKKNAHSIYKRPHYCPRVRHYFLPSHVFRRASVLGFNGFISITKFPLLAVYVDNFDNIIFASTVIWNASPEENFP